MGKSSITKTCSVEGCGHEHRARGFCKSCYNKANKRGEFETTGYRNRTPEERFFDRLKRNKITGCLEWYGTSNPSGYGHFMVDGQLIYTHRYAWERVNGPIPDGLHCLHECDNPPCCEEEHLFLGTHQDNMEDRDAKGRQARGSKNGRAKLNESDVIFIKRLLQEGNYTKADIGRLFKVSDVVICNIALGKSWQSVG